MGRKLKIPANYERGLVKKSRFKLRKRRLILNQMNDEIKSLKLGCKLQAIAIYCQDLQQQCGRFYPLDMGS